MDSRPACLVSQNGKEKSMNKMKKVFAFVIAGIMLLSLAGCSFDIKSLLSPETSYTPAADSIPISGTPKIADEEIKLPCKVIDLKNTGFETDYLVEDGHVKMWHVSEENRGNNLNMYLCLEKDYKDNDHISDEDTVVAILVTQFDHIEFDLNGIRTWTSRDDVLKIAGSPAYKKEIPFDGEYYFYEGDNGQIYRFKFLATDKVEEVLFGTENYMIDEKGQPYTG